jgi:hypothetical protein
MREVRSALRNVTPIRAFRSICRFGLDAVVQHTREQWPVSRCERLEPISDNFAKNRRSYGLSEKLSPSRE